MRKKITTPEGDTYEGEFYENGFLKNGKITFSNGEIHKGEFHKNGKLKKGKITFPDGPLYIGDIFEGEFYENGQIKKGKIESFPYTYVGEFYPNCKIDEDEFGFPFFGYLKNGKVTDCRVDEGYSKEGEFYENGQIKKGKITYNDGTVEKGEFKNIYNDDDNDFQHYDDYGVGRPNNGHDENCRCESCLLYWDQ